MENIETAVIGAGPAGLTAGIYLGRARLKTVVFEKALAGGQICISEWIENFPGFPKGISGSELAAKMHQQAKNCGVEFIEEEAVDIIKKKNDFLVKTLEGAEYHALSVIIAAGAKPKKLAVPGEEEFAGRGVSYCATCDAPLFREKTVVIVGAGDRAVQEALFLTKYCKKVLLVHRRDRLRAVKILAERFAANKKIEPVWNSTVTAILGDKAVKAVNIKNVKLSGSVRTLDCDGVFVFAGAEPNSGFLKKMAGGDFCKASPLLDKDGYVISNDDMKTSVDGIFACGDIRKKLLRQVVTACGEAATAAVSAQHYIEQKQGRLY